MPIPHHPYGTFDLTHQVLQESHHFISADRSPMRLQVQLDLTPSWRHAHGANQVQALIVLQTRAQGGRLSTRRPSAFQRGDQRKARFVWKNERRPSFTTVFLSAARHIASNGQWLFHLVPIRVVAAFENSNRDGATNTKHYSNDNVSETTARSTEQSDPASSNLRHSPTHTLHVSRHRPTGAVAKPTSGWGVPVGGRVACAWGAETRVATGIHSGGSHLLLSQPVLDLVLAVTRIRHVDGAWLIGSMFQMVACADYSTETTNMNISY